MNCDCVFICMCEEPMLNKCSILGCEKRGTGKTKKPKVGKDGAVKHEAAYFCRDHQPKTVEFNSETDQLNL